MLSHHSSGGYVPGLRKITPALRRAEEYARQWVGLPEGASKGGLLRLLEDVPAKRMGLTGRERSFLHRIVKMQPAECFKSAAALVGCDLTRAALALISTYSDIELTAELDVTSRTLARWRDRLNLAGWISFRDSPDRTRFRIGPADAPHDAYGIDLRPIIVRYAELERLRDQAKTDRRAFTDMQRTLSRRRTRLRALEAMVVSDQPLPFVETAMRAIDAVRKGKDLDNATMVLAQVDEAIVQLESYLDAEAKGFFGVTPASAAPDKKGAQLPPTTPVKDSISESLLGREAWREEESPSTDRPLPAPDQIDADEEEEILWQSSTMFEDDDGEDCGPVIEIVAAAVKPGARSPRYMPRVNTPSAGEVVQALPGLLARKDFPFTRHPSFPTDRALVVAYGQAAASRIRLTREEVKLHSAGENDLAFAVAALLAEFSENVRDRRAYLLGLIGRINDPVIPVDLWASWQRLNRVSDAAAKTPRGGAPAWTPRGKYVV